MNKTILYTILTLFVVAISGGCRHDVTCELANYAGWNREARQEMHDEIIHSDLCNADKGNAMLGLASRYAETALGLSDTIAQLLPARERLLYESERQAYGQWREWQETISLDLIGDIWDLWYGGSALGSFQTMHIYQIEDQNLEDNLALFRLLCGSPAHKVIEEEVSLSQVKEEADKLLLDVTDKEYH